MLYHWSQLLNTALGTLDPLERSALSLKTKLLRNQVAPGPKRLLDNGFMSREQYFEVLTSATGKVKTYFAIMGVHHITDLSVGDEMERYI